MEIVAERLGADAESCYKDFGFDLIERYGTLYAAFEQVAAQPDNLKEEGLKGEWIDVFTKVAQENITLNFVQIDGHLELTCPLPDGVDHIRDALLSGIIGSKEKVRIQYVGAPRYRVVVTAADYKTAEDEMKNVTGQIVSTMQACGGKAAFHRESK